MNALTPAYRNLASQSLNGARAFTRQSPAVLWRREGRSAAFLEFAGETAAGKLLQVEAQAQTFPRDQAIGVIHEAVPCGAVNMPLPAPPSLEDSYLQVH